MHTYNAVIQQLKQQKHELLSLQQVERRRAKTSENISAAVLSNLSSGVLFLDANGLVRTANAAAKSILGFASPVGLSVREIFREARFSSAWSRQTLAEAARSSLRAASASRTAEADYVTPGGEPRILEFTISPVFTPSGETLGSRACSPTKLNLHRFKGRTNCAEKCQARWRWRCAIRWLRFRATRSSWQSAAT